MQKMFFKGHLDEDEELFFVAHKHWIEIIKPLLITVIFGFLLPWSTWYLFDLLIWVPVIWSVFFLAWCAYHSMDWFFDALLVTDMAVIDIEWHSLFHRESSRVEYADLKEIGYEINGFWATILNFGTIQINLISGGQIQLEDVANPKKVELEIQGYKQEFLQDRKMTDAASIQEILSEIVKNHIEEHGLPEQKDSSDRKLGRKQF